MNLSGIWENVNGIDNDIVNIVHNGTDLYIHGFNWKSKPQFENYGFAKEVEGTIGEEFEVNWTDTNRSNGSERNKAHVTIVRIKSKTELEQVSDTLLSNKKSGSTTYGKWIRK